MANFVIKAPTNGGYVIPSQNPIKVLGHIKDFKISII